MTQRLPARARSAAAIRGELVRTERRDPTAATRPIQWLGRDQPQVNEWNAEQAFRLGVMANVVAFRCLQVWADTISLYPFRAGMTPPVRPGAKAEFNPKARLAQLLGPPTQRVGGRISGPNQNLSGRILIAWTVMQRVATGRNAWEIEWTGPVGKSEVAGFWPLPAAHFRAVPYAGTAASYFKHYEYGPAHDFKKLSLDQVFYGWTPSGNDVRQPQSALQATRYPLTLAVMSDRQQLAFLKNGAIPAHIVTVDRFPDEDMREDFKRAWSSEYQGVDNAGKVVINEVSEGDGPVSDGIDVQVLGLSQKDAQFAQQHIQSLKEVAWGLGVPWSKIDSADRTFSNAEAEERAWITEKVVPFLAILEDEINLRLAPLVGGEVGWFDLSGVDVLRPAPRFDALGAATLVGAGIVSREEARDEFGLDPEALPEMPSVPELPSGGTNDPVPVGDGDRSGQHRHQRGDDPNGQAQPGAVGGVPGWPRDNELPADGGAGGSERGGGGVHPGASQAPEPIGGETRVLSAEEQETRRAKIWALHDATARTLEARWERRFKALFRKQAENTLPALRGKAGRAQLGAIIRDGGVRADVGAFNTERWRRETAEAAADLYEQVVTQSFVRMSERFGISFDIAQPYAQEFIAARANQLAGQVTDTTYRAIQQALMDGVAAGEGIPELAGRVSHVFDVASTSRATTIARTEVVSASNASSSLAAAQLPSDVVAGQEWIATADGRTREDHAALDGEVIAIGEAFSNGLAYPGDPSGAAEDIVNCRCTVAFLTPDEMGERGRFTLVELRLGEFSLATVRKGETFDEREFRRSLMEVAA